MTKGRGGSFRKIVVGKWQLQLPDGAPLPFVISTEAYPDFLLRAAGDEHVCGSP
jgi:hypothetical protein